VSIVKFLVTIMYIPQNAHSKVMVDNQAHSDKNIFYWKWLL